MYRVINRRNKHLNPDNGLNVTQCVYKDRFTYADTIWRKERDCVFKSSVQAQKYPTLLNRS